MITPSHEGEPTAVDLATDFIRDRARRARLAGSGDSMDGITARLDQALDDLAGQRMWPVTIVLGEPDHDALAVVADWPVTTSKGQLRFRSIPVFRARPGEASSMVARASNGSTVRLPL